MFFTSCDDLLDGLADSETDKEENVGEENPGDDPDEGGDVEVPKGEYLVKSIGETYKGDDGESVNVFTYEYEYIDMFDKFMPVSENLTADGEDYGTALWEYHPEYIDRILMFEGEEDFRWRYALDSEKRVNGSVKEIDLINEWDLSDDSDLKLGDKVESDMSCNVEYDSEGHLLREYDESLSSEYSIEYIWDNGNLTSVESYEYRNEGDTNGDGITDEDDIIERSETFRYICTEYPDNTNLDLNARLCDSYESGLLSDGPCLLGLTGYRSENLCVSAALLDTEDITVTLETGDHNLPVRILVTSNVSNSSLAYEITYTSAEQNDRL